MGIHRFVLQQQDCCTRILKLSRNMLKCPVNPGGFWGSWEVGKLSIPSISTSVPIVPSGLLQRMPILYKKIRISDDLSKLVKTIPWTFWENLPESFFFRIFPKFAIFIKLYSFHAPNQGYLPEPSVFLEKTWSLEALTDSLNSTGKVTISAPLSSGMLKTYLPTFPMEKLQQKNGTTLD